MIRVEGLRELQDALMEVSRATAKNIMARSLKQAGEPVRAAAESLAPVATGTLQESIGTGTKLSRRQKSRFRKQSAVEVYIGVTNSLPQGHLQEFGTVDHGPQPFMRPAWDANKTRVLDSIKELTWAEIAKTAERVAKRKAKAAAKAAKG
jgi:HK97 gp10 family phage protein